MSKPKQVSPEIFEIIEKIARSLSYKFKFDCYDQDDAYQHAVMCGLKAINGYDETKGPPENYLRRCMRTRMINYNRDYDRSKKPLSKSEIRQEAYEMDFEPNDGEYIKDALDAENRALFIKMSMGGKLTEQQKNELYDAVRLIVNAEGIFDESEEG